MSKGLLNDPAWYQALTLAERLDLRRSASGAAVSRGPEPEATIHGCLRLGRQRLLTPQDFEEAETVCGELGLGELLKRMPAGLLPLVGETGWQLSPARALLQEADLVILDESFAALDRENLRLALECVAKRARAVLAIAHP
jgi:ABC-type transport system involved in cytochrome bd biosynthesis fused ATPase/permease subunit